MIAALALCIALATPPDVDSVDLEDFALLDTAGMFHQLSRYADRELVVLLTQAHACPVSERSARILAALRETYEARGVAFLMLNAEPAERGSALSDAISALALEGIPLLVDDAQLIAEMLEVERGGEVLVLDPRAMALRYRGPVDERVADPAVRLQAPFGLSRVLDAALEGQPLSSPAAGLGGAAGALIPFPVRDAHRGRSISYAEEIAPILERRCTGCHVRGGIAPWAMTDHGRVRGWSRMIRSVVRTKRMPPGQLAPGDEQRFADLDHLPALEQQLLVHWIDAGARRSADEPDPLSAIVESPAEWGLGEPDIVLEFPPQEIPAGGVLDYLRVPVEIGHTEDLWIRAMQFKPGLPQALHHVLVYTSAGDGAPADPWETNLLVGYGPGKVDVQLLPQGTGRHVPVGTSLLVQFHFTPYGVAGIDRTRLGIYLHDEPPAKRLVTHRALNARFRIPPHAREHAVRAWTPVFPQDARLYSFTPHMHLRGKRMRYSLISPEGVREELLSVPNYDFNWQMKYALQEPILIPAGSRIIVDGAFDNSAWNPSNPDPDREVTWGNESWDEMFIGYFNYTIAGDERQ